MTRIEQPISAGSDKQFENLRAQLALAGHAVWRTSPADGHVTFFAVGPDGLIHHLWALCDVERLWDELKGGDS